MISPEQYEEIREIVRLHHEAVVEAVCGTDQLAPAVVEKLERLGIPRSPDPSLVYDNSQFGVLTSTIPDPFSDAVEGMSYDDFHLRLTKRQEPLSREEAEGNEWISEKGAVYCRGLGNRVNHATGEVFIEVDRRQRELLETQIRGVTKYGQMTRKTRDEVRSLLGRVTMDWSRDLRRIANVESNNAVQMGRGAAIASEYGDDAAVARVPNPEACDKCKALFLGDDGKPRIFALSEIRYATNAIDPENPSRARRQSAWVPTLESAHPHCLCQTTRVPAGWVFDESWNLVPDDGMDEEGP